MIRRPLCSEDYGNYRTGTLVHVQNFDGYLGSFFKLTALLRIHKPDWILRTWFWCSVHVLAGLPNIALRYWKLGDLHYITATRLLCSFLDNTADRNIEDRIHLLELAEDVRIFRRYSARLEHCNTECELGTNLEVFRQFLLLDIREQILFHLFRFLSAVNFCQQINH